MSVGETSEALTSEQCDYFAVNGHTRICHATGSTTHPYTVLNVAEAACVNAHANHAGDYIAINDPTCGGGGCLPESAPCDATLGCCAGLSCVSGGCVNLCGNGALDAGEECDDGNQTADDGCAGDCRTERCGDGVLQYSRGEICDDGNTVSGDLCSDVCFWEFCGDFITQPELGEECDSGWYDPQFYYGCINCHLEYCGDGYVHFPFETCEDGNDVAGDGCYNCQTEICGNGRWDFGEECDNDLQWRENCPDGDSPYCTSECKVPVCGDGIVHTWCGYPGVEACDDGNTAAGDGCGPTCLLE